MGFLHKTGHIAIMISDTIIYFSGIITGIIIAIFILAYLMSRDIYISPKTKGSKMDVIKIVDENTGKDFIFVNPKRSFLMNVGIIINSWLWIVTGRKKTIKVSPKRIHLTVTITIILILLLVMYIAIDSIFFLQCVRNINCKDLIK